MAYLNRQKCIEIESLGFKYNPRSDCFEKRFENKLLFVRYYDLRDDWTEEHWSKIIENIKNDIHIVSYKALNTDLPPFYYELEKC